MNQLPLSHHASPIHSLDSSNPLHSSVAVDPTPALASVDLLLDAPPAPLPTPQLNGGDVAVLDLLDDEQPIAQVKTEPQTRQETAVKPLGDVNVPLESIKPG